MRIARLVSPSQRRLRRSGRSAGARGLVRNSHPCRDESGFSLIEVAIAIGIFAVVAAFMSQTLAGGMRGILGGKRREVATQEANGVLETARSLSYGAIGLVSTDSTVGTCAAPADPDLSCQSGKLSYRSASTWEPLIWATNPTSHPFNPHKLVVTRASTTLTRYVYVTGVDSDGDGTIDLKRVVVRVSWNNAGSPGPANEVRAQTLISESGALPAGGTETTGTPLTGSAFGTGGNLTIESSLLGLSAPLDVALPTSTGWSKFRAVSETSCTTRSAAMNVLDVIDLPGEQVSVTADDDSRTATPSSPAAQSKSGVLAIPAGTVADLLGTAVTSPISCEADVDEYGHEAGTGSALGTPLTAQTDVPLLNGLLDWLFTLASVQTQPISQQIDHEVVGVQREVHSQAAASTGVVDILKLPAAGITDGLVRIEALSYGASVRAADGTPSAAPTVTSPTVNLRIYDRANALTVCTSRSGSYCIVSVNPAAAGFTGLSIPLQGTIQVDLGLSLLDLLTLGILDGQDVVDLTYSTTVTILPSAKSPVGGVLGSNGENRWSAEYSPVSVSSALTATLLGTTLIDADVDLSLGTVRAQACAGVTCL